MSDDGWRSRKLWVAVLAEAMIFGGFVLTGHPRDLFATYCTAVLAAAGLFKAANLVEKLGGKAASGPRQASLQPPEG